jgi:Concanavalin A-like lectin/glucanases superfamily
LTARSGAEDTSPAAGWHVERVQVIALAVIVAALALFGAGYLVDGSAAPGDDDVVARAVNDGWSSSGVGLSNRERESRRRAQGSAPGVAPPERGRGRRGGQVDDDAVGGSADVIAGTRRRSSGLGPAVGRRDGDVGADGISADLMAARADTIPRAGGGGSEPQPPARHPNEPADEEPPDPQHDPGGVLLSIPLKGSVNPDQGGSVTQADGVVVDGNTVDFTDQAQYTLPAAGHVDGEMGTIAFEIEPHWGGTDQTNNSLLQIRDEHEWENNLQIVKNFNSLRFIIIDETGVETNVNVYIDNWTADQPHKVAATWGEAQMALYIDGQQVGVATLPNQLTFGDTTPIHVGSDFPGTIYSGANSRMSNLTIYGRALSASEIN